MTEYHDLSPTHTGDPRNAARVRSHPYRFSYRLEETLSITDPPTLSWNWEAPYPFPDWVLTADTIRVFSPRMADVIRAHLGPRDEIQWLEGTVVLPDGTAHPHEVPHFLSYPDVLDSDATTWGPSGLPIRWVLSRSKLAGLRLFAREGSAGPVVVDDVMLTALQAASLTGFTATPARIVD
jgi:hypothetical protein